MKLIGLLFLALLIFNIQGLSQNTRDAEFLYLGPSDITIGSVNGIHPNFSNQGFGNYINGDIKQRFRVKGIPLQFVGHVSNEELRIGRPSYFRLSYDATTAKKLSNIDLGEIQLKNKEDLESEKDHLYELEGKLSYKREMLRRLKSGQAIPEINPEIDLTTIDSLQSLELPNVDLPKIEAPKAPNLQKIDSLQLELDQMTQKISEAKTKIDSLELKKVDLKKMNLTSYIPEKFKLKRLNIGLTSLSSGGLSNNAIPIHGIHVEGIYRKTFYDLSAGLTQPFQNFSSQVFNQLITNTQNVFNLNQFFNSDKMRLVTSSIVGYGDKYRSNIKVEHFYTGKSWEAIKDRESERTSNTFNFSGNYNDSLIKNLELGFLVGLSLVHNDSIVVETSNQSVAYRGTAKYKLEKLKGAIEAEYKSLGSDYDGTSQGILINGTTHKMLGYRQKVGRFSSISMRYMEDSFKKTDSIVLFNSSKRMMSSGNLKLNRNNKIQGTYSLIIGSGEEVKDRKGHLGTFSYINEIKIGKNRMTNMAQGGYTTIPLRTSNQEIIHASISSQFSTEKLIYSLKGSYEKYKGITQLFGTNYILEPQISYKGEMGAISVGYQYCKSEQFAVDHGMILKANFRPSEYITWQITGQKWLEKERNFFFIQSPSYVAPWYFDIRLIVHLNVKK